MRSEILSQEQNVIVIKAQYEAPAVTEALKRAYKEIGNNVNIKGFRKGHIPNKILEMHVGRAGIERHAVEMLLRGALENVIREHELHLVTDPSIESGVFKEGSPFEVTMTLEVRPEVTLPDLASLVAERTVHEVTDEMVEKQIEYMLESISEMKTTGEDRELLESDIVDVEYATAIIDENGKQTDLEEKKRNVIELSQPTLRKEIKEALVGKKLAEEITVDLQVEADHPEKRLAGKTLRYIMEVMDIMRKETPEFSDESAEKLSQGRYKKAEELRDAVRQQIAATLSMRDTESLRNSAIEKLGEAAEMEIPDTMLNRQKEAMRRGQEEQIRKDLGQSLEEYLQNNSLNPEEFDKDLEENARRIVRNTLALDALMEREKIGCTAADIDREVTTMAYNMGVEPEELKKYFIAEQGRIQEVVSRVRSSKTVDYLISKVQVTNVPAGK